MLSVFLDKPLDIDVSVTDEVGGKASGSLNVVLAKMPLAN